MKRKRGGEHMPLTLPERLQIRRSAKVWGRTAATFERLARTHGVPMEVVRAVVMG